MNLAKFKPYLSYFLVALSVTPQVLFAIGAVYPPAAAAAVAVQNVIGILGIQPGVVQAGAATLGAVSLHQTPAKP